VNTRLVNGKKMIISTNYTDAELQKKYTPQIFSRISGEFTALPFVGEDIRQVKKGM
jgi:DNA replication protein DnaC